MADLERIYDAIGRASTKTVGDASRSIKTAEGVSVVDADPKRLAESAHLDLNLYSLARMLASEEYSGAPPHLLALAELARNEAKQRGVSVSALLMRSSKASANGFYGEQLGRYASTSRDPNGRHVAAADAALYQGTDIVRGATSFFDPSTQDKGVQGGHPIRSSEEIIAKWGREGLEWVGPIPGVEPYHLMAFRKAASPRVDQALTALADARSGKAVGGVVLAGFAGYRWPLAIALLLLGAAGLIASGKWRALLRLVKG